MEKLSVVRLESCLVLCGQIISDVRFRKNDVLILSEFFFIFIKYVCLQTAFSCLRFISCDLDHNYDSRLICSFSTTMLMYTCQGRQIYNKN